ncbi:unnamed protein product [Acanthosepion pharaonis]|uniref:Uncharacterized protein n=1 Tax=Acanthosepion pharaonis TaxID=158019 RepID=A0A812CX31_ACAPH|nr:unnamed protein product [Sepia pharaonis]
MAVSLVNGSQAKVSSQNEKKPTNSARLGTSLLNGFPPVSELLFSREYLNKSLQILLATFVVQIQKVRIINSERKDPKSLLHFFELDFNKLCLKMTTLQQFFDKENVGASSSVKNRVGLTVRKQQQENACLVTPRQALGNINRDLSANRLTPLSKKLPKTPRTVKVFTENHENSKPRKALTSISENKLLADIKQKKSTAGPLSLICSSTSSRSTVHVDEIEHIHKPQDKEDDYEDIFPKKERVSSYIDKLISWRPSCFKKWDVDEESEDDNEMLLIDDELPVISRITRGECMGSISNVISSYCIYNYNNLD